MSCSKWVGTYIGLFFIVGTLLCSLIDLTDSLGATATIMLSALSAKVGAELIAGEI